MKAHPTHSLSRGAIAALLLAGAASGQTLMDRLDGPDPVDHLGQTLELLGDVDGDGIDDILVGVPWADTAAGVDSGAVRVVSGLDRKPIYTAIGKQAQEGFGITLARLGDVDGDAVDDFAVGAPKFTGAVGPASGRVYVISGANGVVLYAVDGEAAGDWFGVSIVALDDYDGDSVDDFAVGAPYSDVGGTDAGRVSIVSGATGAPLDKMDGTQDFENFGRSLAYPGDVSGDGVGDVFVGSPGVGAAGTSPGMVHFARGLQWTPVPVLFGVAPLDFFGTAMAVPGDVDGDGSPDLLVGAPGADAPASGSGAARIYSTGTLAVLGTFFGNGAGDAFGRTVAAAGDTDADGVPDFLIGAQLADSSGVDSGSAFLYSGATLALAFSIDGQAGDLMGIGLAGVGDVDLDGYDDFMVGANFADQGAPDSGSAWLYSGRTCFLTVYCTAKTNSLGCVPEIGWSGIPLASVGTDQFHVRATNLLSGHVGLMIWSLSAGSTPFGGGTLCLSGAVNRTTGMGSGGPSSPPYDCSGVFDYYLQQSYMAANGLVGGTTMYAQFWSRDTGFPAPNAMGLTDALRFQIVN